MKRLLLLFLVSLFGTIGWAQSNVGVETQPKIEVQTRPKVGVETQLSSPSPGSAVPNPKNYALLVGISKYKDTLALATLKYADKDARDFARFLREQFGKDIKIDTLINDKANSAVVLGKLIQVSESNRYNRIFILISGHGGTHKRDTENGYLFTEDFETIELVGNTGAGAVRMGKLRDMMTDLIKKGMSIFLVVDACHAGSFYPEKISEVVSSWSKTDRSGIFLASQKEEKAIESRELENGLLVHYFLKGSSHDADTDSNGLIWVKELGEYIAQKVPEQAGKVGQKQTPLTIGRDSLVIFAKQMTLTTKDTPSQYLNTPASAGFSIPDSSSIIKEKLENSIKKKDLDGAYRWLERFKKLDSLEAFQELKYAYVAACYNEAVKLSGQLSDFYVAYEFEDDTIRTSKAINQKRDSLNVRIDNILTQLNRSLALLSKEGAFYDEINYRKLVFEGHLNGDTKKLEEAIKINPDFSFVYLILKKCKFVKDSSEDIDKKLVEFKNLITQQPEKSVFYGMDRNSLTVLPVQIHAPGLGLNRKITGKPIYTPKQIFEKASLKNYSGDILVSEKYFYNKIGFNSFSLFKGLIQDSLKFYKLVGLTPSNKTDREAVTKLPALSTFIGDYLKDSNVGTDILKIWTHKDTLMSRILYAKSEAEKRERVDEKKLEVFEKLIRKNYVLVLAIINPMKEVNHNNKRSKYSYKSVIYKAKIEGFLYRVDTTSLNLNDIKDKHPLQFIKQISKGSLNCDPRSDELVEILGSGSLESFQNTVNSLMAKTIKEQADYFFKSKLYGCAKNYYEYLLYTSDKDKDIITKRVEECNKLLSKSPSEVDDKTCLVTQENTFEDWVYAQSATNEVIEKLETDIADVLGVKAFIFKTSPYITAEIGKKQGLYTDQRYLVYRKTLIDGKEGQKRIGTLRVIKVAGNTDKFKKFERRLSKTNSTSLLKSVQGDVSSTNSAYPSKDSAKVPAKIQEAHAPPSAKELRAQSLDNLMKQDLATMSIFKQVDGEKIEEKDLLIQNNDMGLALQVGYGSRLSASGLIIGADFRLASFLKMRMPLTGIKLGVNIARPNDEKVYERYKIPSDRSSVFEIYIARELYMSPKFDLKPFFGVSVFNDKYHLLLGTTAYLNVLGKKSNTKVKLAPEFSYTLGYSLQYGSSLRIEF